MKPRVYWGIAILIFLLSGISVFLLTRNTDTEPPIKVYVADPRVKDQSAVKPGYMRVQHGDHFHDVKIPEENNPVVQPVEQDMPVLQEPDSDTEQGIANEYEVLLNTNPVEALRQYAKDTGHWSLDYIPPFPPDDIEAAILARAVFAYIDHYKIKGLTDSDHDKSPSMINASQIILDFQNRVNESTREVAETGQYLNYDLRWFDLAKLIWVRSDNPTSSAYNNWPSSFDNEGGTQ